MIDFMEKQVIAQKMVNMSDLDTDTSSNDLLKGILLALACIWADMDKCDDY